MGIDVKKVDKQFTHAIHVKNRYANGNFIDKLTKWHQWFLLDICHIIYVKY